MAKTYRCAGGFTGLARALDPEGRERLKARLSTAIEAGLKKERTDCPAEVEGLIALARSRKIRARSSPSKSGSLPRMPKPSSGLAWPRVALFSLCGLSLEHQATNSNRRPR